jgi:hypothetical protein
MNGLMCAVNFCRMHWLHGYCVVAMQLNRGDLDSKAPSGAAGSIPMLKWRPISNRPLHRFVL